jgi:hypothetical protein
MAGKGQKRKRTGAQVDSLISAALGRIYCFSTQETEGNIQDQWRRIWRRTPWRPGIRTTKRLAGKLGYNDYQPIKTMDDRRFAKIGFG